MGVEMVSKREGFKENTCVYAQLQENFCGYSIKSLSSSLDYFQHQVTSGSSYDDILFSNWKESGSSVTIEAFSKSEWPNAYDFDTNFCNIFNLFRNGNASSLDFEMSIKYENCQYHPDTSNGYDAAYKQ